MIYDIMPLSLITAAAAGLIIELFFRVIKYKDQFNKQGPVPIPAYGTVTDASNYMSVSQYLSGGNRRWTNYFLFRLVPPCVIFILLSAIIARYLDDQHYVPLLLLSASVSLLFRDLSQLFQAKLISEKLLYTANSILVLLIALIVGTMAQHVSFAILAPNIDGIVDNLWSSLFVAMLVILYLNSTSMGKKYEDETAKENATNNYVVTSYNVIRESYADVINEACQTHLCSQQILYAVLVYENMNRPAWLRKLENLTVSLLGLSLTVGIAQVRSDRPLSNEESISQAAKILADSEYIDSKKGSDFINIGQLENILKNYNSDHSYAASVSSIITRLRTYAPELWSER